jgi:hypothetical protein
MLGRASVRGWNVARDERGPGRLLPVAETTELHARAETLTMLSRPAR